VAPSLDDAIGQLTDRSSTKRRSAAKRLRVLGDRAAGPALLDALRAEVIDQRTWETQYQMIMALGACQHTPANDFLEELASQQHDYKMVGVALGDALTRIEWATSQNLTVVDRSITNGAASVTGGTFRAIAMLRLVPPGEVIERIVAFATKLPVDDPLRYWVAAAAAGWESPSVKSFLLSCLASPRSELVDVATESLTGTYIKHRPL